MVAVNVVCVGGPKTGQEYANIEPDDTGYLLFDGALGTADALYRIDYEAEPVDTEHGPAQPANYVGEEKD